MIRALCEREYLQPSSVLSLDSDRVQRIEHSSGECVSCERGDVTSELYRMCSLLIVCAHCSLYVLTAHCMCSLLIVCAHCSLYVPTAHYMCSLYIVVFTACTHWYFAHCSVLLLIILFAHHMPFIHSLMSEDLLLQ